jgi:hypothetical protein
MIICGVRLRTVGTCGMNRPSYGTRVRRRINTDRGRLNDRVVFHPAPASGRDHFHHRFMNVWQEAEDGQI